MKAKQENEKLSFIVAAVLLLHFPFALGNSVFLQGEISNAFCDSIKIGPYFARLSETGQFTLRMVMPQPGYVYLVCEDSFQLFLGLKDSVHILADAKDFPETLRFTGRGAEVNDYLAGTARSEKTEGLRMLQSFFELAEREEKEFLAGLDSLFYPLWKNLDSFLAEHTVNERFAKFERAKILYQWAKGRLDYAAIHRQKTGDFSFETGLKYDGYLVQVNFNDPELLQLPEYVEFLKSYLRAKTRKEIRQDPALQKGDNQQTRAQFQVALKTFNIDKVRNRLLSELLKYHVENYGIKNLEPLAENFRHHCSDPVLVNNFEKLYEREKRSWSEETAEVYKAIGDVKLDAHLLYPDGHKPSDRRPAIVWFHGGSWYEGRWDYCLRFCGHFRSKGMVIVMAEYRLYDRHGTNPIDCIADAKSAIRWVRSNASRLGIHPDRIVAAGFSSGGHLAASTALLERFDEPTEDRKISSAPNAALLFSACVEPTLDPWYNFMTQPISEPKDGSPSHNVKPGAPPMILFHGTGDGSCSFGAAEAFAQKMRQASNRCELRPFKGRSHFFLLAGDKDRTEVLNEADRFLVSIGFLKNGSR